MSIRTSRWPAGIPCWTDLETPDVAAAEAFYGPLLGWDFMNDDTGEWGGYAIAQMKEVAAAGLGPIVSEAYPPGWILYFASDDAEKTASAITSNGGTMLRPVSDVGELGRMGVAKDPAGAIFGLWEAGLHIGSNITTEPGGITWEDLRTPDPDTARTFYAAVFGFEFQTLEMAGPDYTTFSRPSEADAPMGGIGGMMGDTDAPPHWLVYFGTADAAAAAETAKTRGGTVVVEPFDSPYGTMTGLLDPAGARFWLVQVAEDMVIPHREE